MRFERQSGVFCHVTSLPGPHGVGDLGAGAREFVDFLARADQSLWQVCPLGPTVDVHGHSPYQAYSAFAGNPLLVDLRDLQDRGYLDELQPPDDAFSPDAVAYDAVESFKLAALRDAHEAFEARASEDERAAFEAFREREADWLADYALFRALGREYDQRSWTGWPEPVRTRDPDALADAREAHAGEVDFRAFVQWVFDEQWRDLHDYAAERGVSVVGDVPIYVALDSADVWAAPGCFDLDAEGRPAAVAGVPPNPGDDGQRWGNPVYDWDALREREYGWWLRRLERLLDLVDAARIDHFKGFDQFWAIPADADDPAAGEWREGPGAAFFEAARERIGELPFFVEDLGFLDPGVVGLRERFDLPGLRVPHYADWCAEGDMYQPMHYPADAVAYTSTHDTDTAAGYYDALSERQRECLQFNLGTDGESVHWDLLEAVWNSEAAVAFTTVPDLLGLGSVARFNTPGTNEGNWDWRVRADALSADLADALAAETDATLR